MRPLARLLALLAALATVISLAPVLTSPAAAEDAVPQGSWPLRPRPEVVRRFDPPASAWGAGHRGVDLLGHAGQAVRAAAPGVVVFAGSLAGRGVLTIDHGATRTTYEPVDATVRVGQPVRAGQVVGHLRLALGHCFPRACLHWGWLRGERYLDPLALVGAGPVRLLPWDHPPVGESQTSAGWSSAVAASGPGVRLLVGLAQAIGGDVGVDLGRGQ